VPQRKLLVGIAQTQEVGAMKATLASAQIVIVAAMEAAQACVLTATLIGALAAMPQRVIIHVFARVWNIWWATRIQKRSFELCHSQLKKITN